MIDEGKRVAGCCMVGEAVTVAGHLAGYAALHYDGHGDAVGDWSIGLRCKMLHTEVWLSHLALSTPRVGAVTVAVAGHLAAPNTQYPCALALW